MIVFRSREPVYQGKTLTRWLEEAADDGTLYNNGLREDTAVAVRAMGRDAVPFLVEMIKTKDGWFREELQRFAQKKWLPLRVQSAPDLQVMGTTGFAMLGKEGKSAIPALLECLKDDDQWVRSAAAESLSGIGDDSAEVVAALVNYLPHANPARASAGFNSVMSEQFIAIRALARMGPTALPALAQLTALTNSSQPLVADAAQLALLRIQGQSEAPFFERLEGTLGQKNWFVLPAVIIPICTNSEAAIPYCLNGLRQTNADIQWRALFVLDAIHQNPQLCIPAIAPFLQSTNDRVRFQALDALGAFGGKSKPLIPMAEVERCLGDRDADVRRMATNAMRLFAPERLEQLQNHGKL